ncbi:hypothetical protein QA601_11445 [Chitinispirillales bacterium ANBcel5]|uniref:hypothetical protein n=1 Tax=Cellulosispirillum alkaliphilum TaxID=3039283 RepID=UPI002A4F2943|nr:hypothetical protein [Chitinispirillales bacterium ANBcel5]
MDPVSNTAASIEAVNQVMQSAKKEGIEAAQKHLKVAVEMKLSVESGKGENVDLVA